MLKTFVPLAAAVLLLTACPGNEVSRDYSKSGPAKHSETSTQNPQAVPENSTAMSPTMPTVSDSNGSHPEAAAAPTVDVQLDEYQIRMPDTLPRGKSTLQVSNSGKENHGLVIEGNGYRASLPEPLTRGDRGTLDVVLQPGSYQAYCPVEGHKGKGMLRTVTVR